MKGLMMDEQLSITSILHFAERAHPNTEIVSVTHDFERHRYTFADAFRRVRQLANALVKIGAKPADCIGTLAWNDHRHFELYYAVSCSGMICHTINPRLFPEQIEYIINHAEDRFIFVDLAFLPLIEPAVTRLPSIRGVIVLCGPESMPKTDIENIFCYETLLSEATDEYDFPNINEETASSLCYTSGTTGHPKGVLYSHRSTVLHSYTICLPDVMNLHRGCTVMPLVPMFHVNAWGIPYGAVLTGCKLVLPGPRVMDGAILTRLINEEQVSYSAGVPTIWQALLNYLDKSKETIEPLQRIVVGGAACPATLMEGLENRYGTYVHTGWGMTELSPLGTFNPRLEREEIGEERHAAKRVKAGRIIYGVEMKIVDEQNNNLPHDGITSGALKVRGPWVCKQYFKVPDGDSHDRDGWFCTGDIATIDAEGYMQITDRQKDVIKSGGEWISSIDLENTAVNHPAVAEAAVIGMPHHKWSERPLLLVVRKENNTIDKTSMLQWFEGKVASWWIPNDCLFVEQLPHTATGKLDKKLLRNNFKDYCFPN